MDTAQEVNSEDQPSENVLLPYRNLKPDNSSTLTGDVIAKFCQNGQVVHFAGLDAEPEPSSEK